MNNYTIIFFQNEIGRENNETEIFNSYKLGAEFCV